MAEKIQLINTFRTLSFSICTKYISVSPSLLRAPRNLPRYKEDSSCQQVFTSLAASTMHAKKQNKNKIQDEWEEDKESNNLSEIHLLVLDFVRAWDQLYQFTWGWGWAENQCGFLSCSPKDPLTRDLRKWGTGICICSLRIPLHNRRGPDV